MTCSRTAVPAPASGGGSRSRGGGPGQDQDRGRGRAEAQNRPRGRGAQPSSEASGKKIAARPDSRRATGTRKGEQET